jgi:Leucine-rich repeat (LRR) protein
VANRQISNKCVKRVLGACPQLSILNLNQNPFITSKSLHYLLKFSEKVCLTSISLAYHAYIDDEAVDKLLKAYPRLKVFNITGTSVKCPKIALSSLEHLYMNDCKALVFDSVARTVTSCAMLKSVELFNCKRINSVDLSRLQREYPVMDILF